MMAGVLHETGFRVSDRDLDDLRSRLRGTRWAHQVSDAGWAQGTERGFLEKLVAQWAEFDWRTAEGMLNRLPQYIARIDGLDIHFVHRPAESNPDARTVLLGHGCFSSFYEFHKVVDQLADPASHGGRAEDAVHVVVVSWPGFALSSKPNELGFGTARAASVVHRLMTDVLGYPSFIPVGGSWGALVAMRLAAAHSASIDGIFLSQACPPANPVVVTPECERTQAEKEFLACMASFREEETGYAALLTTRPQSIAYALNDSPAGLAGWVVEKTRAWTDCDGNLGSTITLDEVLTGLSITWFTGSAASGHRYYWEMAHGDWSLPAGERITVPTGVLGLPGGLPHERVPEETISRVFDLRYYAMGERGGHYPALEVPEVFVPHLRAFLSKLDA